MMMNRRILNLTLTFILFIVLTQNAQCEYFSSINHLNLLFQTEDSLIKSIGNFLTKEIDDTQKMRAFLDNSKGGQMLQMLDYGNPIASFVALKRFNDHWNFVFRQVFDETIKNSYLKFINGSEKLNRPTKADLVGAAIGVNRLQETYKLPTIELAEGNISGMNYRSNMTSNDCYILGAALFEKEHYRNALSWLSVARRKFVQNTDMKDLKENKLKSYLDLLRYMCHASFHLQNFKLSSQIAADILRMDPQNAEALSITASSKELLRMARMNLLSTGSSDTNKLEGLASALQIDNGPELDDLFLKTCRQELTTSTREQRKLRCRYVTNNVAYRYLAPFKQEELYLEPRIVVYHDAINEIEISLLKQNAMKRLQRSGVDKDSISDGRISKTFWVDSEDMEGLKPLERRLEDFTKLSLENSESFQVVNYGIGGYYVQHYDFFSKREDCGPEGYRIATTLFYINKVDLGGGTAFPFLKVYAPPTYRSLLVWFNIHRSGNPDYRHLHGGCPVIKGSKWIATKWFHEAGQEFILPCELKPDHERSEKHKEFYNNQIDSL